MTTNLPLILKTVNIHYVVAVGLEIITDADGNSLHVERVLSPKVDLEPFSGIDGHGGDGDVWDADTHSWRPSTEAEWNAGANVIESDLRTQAEALDAIARVLDDPEDDDLTLLGKISAIVSRTGRGGAR
jgi:hypothetical protein